MDPLMIRVIVDSYEGDKITEYTFDINDYQQRRVFAEQMTNAYLGGQTVTTYADSWTPDTAPRLKAFMAGSWIPTE